MWDDLKISKYQKFVISERYKRLKILSSVIVEVISKLDFQNAVDMSITIYTYNINIK